MRLEFRYILYAVLILILQVTVFKNINLGGTAFNYIDIIIFPLAVLILPINYPPALVVTIGFVGGLFVDVFYGTPGLHTSAFVFMAYLRKTILNIFEPRTGYKVDDNPINIRQSSLWYFQYAASLLFAHLLFYFAVEYFTVYYFAEIWLKTIFSFCISLVLIMIHYSIVKSFKSPD